MAETLAVRERGTAGVAALVFLHGVGADASSWDRAIDELEDYHCLALDLPGHGRSAAMGWASVADTADAVADLIRSRCQDGKAVVVGLSLGGAVCYALLARHPKVVRKAVIDGASVSATRAAPLMKVAVAAISPLLHREWVIRAVASTIDLPTSDVPSFAQALRRVEPRSFRRAFADAQDAGVLHSVLQSEVPLLLVAGEREMTDIHAMNAALAAIRPGAQARVVPGVGHGWVAGRPVLHARMTRAWTDRRPLPDDLTVETIDWQANPRGRRVARAARELSMR